ncbi:MAG: site-specific integrase [Bryobacteraceae bacterium]
MSPTTLKLFRRHEAGCVRGYQKEDRVYEHDTIKVKNRRDAKADCHCPIYAEGNLGSGANRRYLRPKTTGQRIWDDAKKMAASWAASGSAETAPAPANDGYQLVTVRDAVEAFLDSKRLNYREAATVKQFEQLLTGRLIPFADAEGIAFVQQMDSAVVWSRFRKSWVSLNPTKNRKTETTPDPVQLGPNTIGRLVTSLRAFLTFCVSREWLSDNWASRRHGIEAPQKIEPKEPFSETELKYIYEATKLVTDGKGFKVKRTGQQNATEVLNFILTMRHTGMRISDAVMLTRDQLVEFAVGPYTHAISFRPKKTENSRKENHVHVPAHPDLVAALMDMPLKQDRYFFFGGGNEERRRTNTTAWRKRVTRVFEIAADLMEEDGAKFENPPIPHRFRHTFCATLLRAGVSTRLVAQYVGDTEEVVRTHYAKFCVAEQREGALKMAEALKLSV